MSTQNILLQTVQCRRRVLIIEDEDQTREVHEENLRRWGYEPISALGEGMELLRDARRKAKERRCHIALVDVHLLGAGDEGLDLVPELRPTISIIVSTDQRSATARKALKEKGAFDFVGKEEGPRRLRQALGEVERQICQCAIAIQWYAQYGPVDILRQLSPAHSEIPVDEPHCVLGRLYARREGQKDISRIELKPITEYYRSPESVTPLVRSVVLVARPQNTEGQWHQEEIIKLALCEQIRDEIANYRTYVEGLLSTHRTARIEDRANSVELWDIGAVRYTNIATGNRRPLRQWYASAKPVAVKKALNDLFKETLGPWYNIASQPQSRMVYAYYIENFAKLAFRLNEQRDQGEYIVVPGVPGAFLNPVTWARNHGHQSRFVSRWNAYIHGDLHSDNIFVDQHAQTCVIDYERSGPGYYLRDFVELEADIRLRLLPITHDQLALVYNFDRLLLAQDQPDHVPRWSPIPGADEHMQAELRKAFDVICTLRLIARQMTHFERMDEYYWALLMETLISVLRNYNEWTDHDAAELAKDRALLSAALLCERLSRWGQAWPLPARPERGRRSPRNGSRADPYARYEGGIGRLIDRLPRDHPRFSEVLLYQQRLGENIMVVRQHGDTDTRKAERSQIIDQLNNLALAALGISFNDLCDL